MRKPLIIFFAVATLAAAPATQPDDADVAALRSPDPSVQADAAMRLQSKRGQSTLLAISKLFDDPDPQLRTTALSISSMMHAGDSEAWPVVEKLFALSTDDPSFYVRGRALNNFQGLGHDCEGALLPTAQQMLKSGTEQQRTAAAKLIGYMNTFNPAVLPALTAALEDKSIPARRAASEAIVHHRPSAGADLLSHADLQVRDSAALTFFNEEMMHRMSETGVPENVAALKNNSDASIRLLGELMNEGAFGGNRVPLPFAMLTPALRDQSSATRRYAGRSIILGTESDHMTRPVHGTVALLAAANDPDPAIVADAIRTLTWGHNIGRDGGPYVPGDETTKAMAKNMQAQSAETRKAAMDAYAKLPIKQAVAPWMWKFALMMFDDPSPDVRASALITCRTVLAELLKDQVKLATHIPPPLPETTQAATQPARAR